MGLSREVIDRAAVQGGIVTRGQLLEMGHKPGGIDWLLRAGAITLVSAGVYRVLPPADHVDLIRGAIHTLPDAVASHQSAAYILELPRLPKLVPTVSVESRTTHLFPDVVVRRYDDLRPWHLTRVDGIRVTGVPRTLFDLAGILGFEEFDLIGEAAVIAGRVPLASFERVTLELARRGKRGSRAAHDFIETRLGSDPRATVLEKKGRATLEGARLPRPIPQFPMPWDSRRRFDDAYPDATLALEWDSRAWHEQRAAMQSDRARDREAAIHGWYVARFTWNDVTKSPNAVASSVADLLKSRAPTT
jgi:hypothetical protein